MIVKVCGMRDAQNIREVIATGIDWMGMIFYPKSSRFVSHEHQDDIIRTLSAYPDIRRVGVFVNSSLADVLRIQEDYSLDIIQLHGHESSAFCSELRSRGLVVMKAFSIASAEDMKSVAEYDGAVDYLLFDTKCSTYGGSGQSFDWSLLDLYDGATPFLLSGGLGSDSLEALSYLHHPRWQGIDLNSRFETAPALKDAARLHNFIERFKQLNF